MPIRERRTSEDKGQTIAPGLLSQGMAASSSTSATPAVAEASLTQDEQNMKAYVNALVVPRASMADDDSPFGFVIPAPPPAKEQVDRR